MHNIIAVTSEGPALTDMVDPRFGRAAGFVVVNLATGATSYVDNGGSQVMSQGAGIQAAENVAKAGAQVVLSGFVGPKAFTALSAAGIAVIQDVENRPGSGSSASICRSIAPRPSWPRPGMSPAGQPGVSMRGWLGGTACKNRLLVKVS